MSPYKLPIHPGDPQFLGLDSQCSICFALLSPQLGTHHLIIYKMAFRTNLAHRMLDFVTLTFFPWEENLAYQPHYYTIVIQ